MEHPSDTATHIPIRGTLLVIVRGVWAAFVLLGIVYAILEMQHMLRQTEDAGFGVWISTLSSPQRIASLERIGLSGQFDFVAQYLGFAIFAVIGLVVATLIAIKRSDNWVAMAVSLLIILVVLTAWTPSTVGLPPLVRGLFNLISFAGYVLIYSIIFMFPDGKPRPRWTLFVIPFYLAAGFWNSFFDEPMANWSPIVLIPYAALSLSIPIYALIYRYRKVATPPQRQQIKWVIAGLVATLISIFIFIALASIYPLVSDNWWAGILNLIGIFVQTIGAVAFVLGFGVALISSRLWDIDAIINRSLVYGTLTVVLGAVLIGGFFGIQALFKAVLGSDLAALAAVIPLVIVMVMFNPLRSRLRKFVDQRIYSINIDYQKRRAFTPSPVAENRSLHTQILAFENMEPIGKGGMAEVYKTHHPTLDKPVAVKVLPPSLADSDEFRRRFKREADAINRLRHPNIVEMYDFGESHNLLYMVLEYIDGEDLSKYLKQHGTLSLDQAHGILSEVASALDYAHSQGMVHRDIKPSNVMLENSGTGRAVLMDFGIAKIADAVSQLTKSGGIMGSMDYVAPEQISEAAAIDGRADVYALGVMAFEMLTGQLPFHGANVLAKLMSHLSEPPPNPSALRPDLPQTASLAILRAMEKAPQDRFATAADFVAALC